jgi:hypothetical protein
MTTLAIWVVPTMDYNVLGHPLYRLVSNHAVIGNVRYNFLGLLWRHKEPASISAMF